MEKAKKLAGLRLAERVSVSLRLQGVSSRELSAIHGVADTTTSETKGVGARTSVPGDNIPLAEVVKSELQPDGTYTIQLKIYTRLEGYIYPPPPGKEGRWAAVFPSRKGLLAILDVLQILADNESIGDGTPPHGYA